MSAPTNQHAAQVMAMSRQQITQFFSARRIVAGSGVAVSNASQPYVSTRP